MLIPKAPLSVSRSQILYNILAKGALMQTQERIAEISYSQLQPTAFPTIESVSRRLSPTNSSVQDTVDEKLLPPPARLLKKKKVFGPLQASPQALHSKLNHAHDLHIENQGCDEYDRSYSYLFGLSMDG